MRLVTRGDLDGLACAVVITTFEDIEETVLIHPQDITDQRFEIKAGDVVANLPWDPRCSKWFDHHLLTDSNQKPPADFEGRHELAPSAAQLVWEHYGSDPRFTDLIAETNRLDSAQLSQDDVLNPQGHILYGFTLDGRTGLGAFSDYFEKSVAWFREKTIAEILAEPEVAARVAKMRERDARCREIFASSSRLDGNVVVTDLRDQDELPIGNRFLIYTMFPEANVSLRLHWGPQRRFCVAAVGHSIFDRTCQTNVGELMSKHGGGGHRAAGTTPLPVEEADERIAQILAELKENG